METKIFRESTSHDVSQVTNKSWYYCYNVNLGVTVSEKVRADGLKSPTTGINLMYSATRLSSY